jgi:hypothetical protein
MEKIRELFGRHGGEARGVDAGQDGQQQELRSVELPMGDSACSGEQHSSESCCENTARRYDGCSNCEDSGSNGQLHQATYKEGPDGGLPVSSASTKTAVYDILNCGSRKSFTVIDENGRTLLVHNCDEIGSKDFVAGGKDLAVMESLHDVSNCLRLVSARYTDQGVFHEACESPDSARNGVHLVLDWKDNPIHGKHSYRVKAGVPVAVKPGDQEFIDKYHAENKDLRGRLERKGFKFDDVVRSPWYDMRCLRPTSTPRLIASQLDRDPRGAVGKVFPTEMLDRLKRETCKPEIWRGTPVFDSETLALKGLIQRDDGALKLWLKPGIDNSPGLGPFTIGCDVAIGSDGAYSSNSVASIIDNRTGEQVGEYTIKGMPMIKFARVCVGLSIWLRGALLGWEDSGMVAPFAKEIMEVLYYGNVYYREATAIGVKKKTKKLGWWNGKDEDKAGLFEKMAIALESGQYIVRSHDLIRECGEYEWENGKIIHKPTKNKKVTEKAHGDRCIASGVSWLIYSEDLLQYIDSDEEISKVPEYGSFLWREQQEEVRSSRGTPAFGLKDLMFSIQR